MIEFSENISYGIYFFSIIGGTFFAYLAQKYAVYKKNEVKVQKLFWCISFLFLCLPVALRGNGVDQDNYILRYTLYNKPDLAYAASYRGDPEPLFFLLNLLAAKLGGFQWVYIFEAFLSLYFVYLAFEKKIKEINLGISVFIYATAYYLFLFGLVRMSIAIGMVMYSYHFLEERKFGKYCAMILLATGFHYSAIIMLPMYFILENGIRKKGSRDAWIRGGVIFLFVFMFMAGAFLIVRLQGHFTWLRRYSGYFSGGMNWRVIFNILIMIPIILLAVLYGRYLKQAGKWNGYYMVMLLTITAIVFASMTTGLIRLTYYFYPAGYYLYAHVYQIMSDRREKAVYLRILLLFCICCFLYSFTSPLWKPYLIPYVLFVK